MGKFEKGNSGRPHGAVNKSTKLVKQVFADVFNQLQTEEDAKEKRADLKSWALKNTTEFYKLASKLIPTEVDANGNVQLTVKFIESE